MSVNEPELKQKIMDSFKNQGFYINPHLRLINDEKTTIRNIHEQKRIEQLKIHKNSLIEYFELVKDFKIDGNNLNPKKIDLRLIEVKCKRSLESKLFFWWNLIWWSLPYDRPVGRQLRFILWDDYHDVPFGLIGLQSPPLYSSVRDNYIGLKKENRDYWINQSMYGQRIGALPPYNELLGGKMVAMSLISDEIKNIYKKKYQNRVTKIRKRKLPNNLLFITTTSAFGRSSIYERLKYNNNSISEFMGFTSGAGTFHLPQNLYEDLIHYMKEEGINVNRDLHSGPSRKLKIIDRGFKKLGLTNLANSYIFHNIKRGYYLFSNVKNLNEIINKNEDPQWIDFSFEELLIFWRERWCLPRSQRNNKWNKFDFNKFVNNKYLNLTKL